MCVVSCCSRCTIESLLLEVELDDVQLAPGSEKLNADVHVTNESLNVKALLKNKAKSVKD